MPSSLTFHCQQTARGHDHTRPLTHNSHPGDKANSTALVFNQGKPTLGGEERNKQPPTQHKCTHMDKQTHIVQTHIVQIHSNQRLGNKIMHSDAREEQSNMGIGTEFVNKTSLHTPKALITEQLTKQGPVGVAFPVPVLLFWICSHTASCFMNWESCSGYSTLANVKCSPFLIHGCISLTQHVIVAICSQVCIFLREQIGFFCGEGLQRRKDEMEGVEENGK